MSYVCTVYCINYEALNVNVLDLCLANSCLIYIIIKILIYQKLHSFRAEENDVHRQYHQILQRNIRNKTMLDISIFPIKCLLIN